MENDGIYGFSLLDTTPKESMSEAGTVPSATWLEGSPAVMLAATSDGRFISRSVQEGDQYRIVVMSKPAGSETYQEEWILEGVNFPEHFWSSTCRYLLYSSVDGCLELFDTVSGKNRWFGNNNFAPNGMTPVAARFTPNDRLVYLEKIDRYGYRQIRFIRLADTIEKDFSQGHTDHYAPVLTRDGRMLAYRIGDLPDVKESNNRSRHEEALFFFDFEQNRSIEPGKRSIIPGQIDAGPVLSGDGRYAYFFKENQIFRILISD